MFNKSFLTILNSEDILEEMFDPKLDTNKIKKDLEGVIKIAPKLMQNMKKPQQLIETTEDYYLAFDIFSDYNYICFKELMMIDIDIKKYFITDNFIKSNFSSYSDYCFSIYKSKNGYHVFCISKRFNYRSKEFILFMLENLCDYYYCVFSYIRGCSVRLSKKEGETGTLYTHLGIFGNTELIDKKLLDLVELHYSFSLH
jgi:hypothetical protein